MQAQTLPPRQMLGHERVAMHKFWVDMRQGFPQTLTSVVLPLYTVNSPFFRGYVPVEGYDNQFTLQFGLGVCDTGAFSNGIPQTYQGQTFTTISSVFSTTQGGEPTCYKVPAERQEFIGGQTHCQITVEVSSYKPKMNLPIIIEIWGDAWRHKYQGNVGVNQVRGTDTETQMSYPGSSIRNDLDNSRQTLSE